MSKYLLEIILQSDMCVSDGGVYNSSVDIEVCYDSYGFPYIPAKRIRGCLRECAIELQDWGMEVPWQKMFGEKGDSANRAAIRISDGKLKEFQEMHGLAKKNSGKLVFHPQNILNHFTYTRTQTSIDYNTGVADASSLRTMRVVNKGTVFLAEVDMDPDYQKYLEDCCAIFHNIGVSRTRGLGEIDVSLQERKASEAKMEHVPYEEGAEILSYKIYLEEPVICKSVNGEEARSLDYLEGSKMQGLLMENAASKEEFIRIMDSGELFCSNAYAALGDKRCTEVPAYIYSVKNDKKHYANRLYPDPAAVKEESLQLSMMKHCYVFMDAQQKLYKKEVRMEERYHHRRPEDKSIGRAAEEVNGDSQFYQISSIEAGQEFCGYIAGTAEQIKAVYDILSKQERYYIGYGRSSEYGKVRLEITGMEKMPQPVEKTAKTFCVKLEAPTIVYNKNAFYSANADDLIDEANAVLGISEDMLDKQSDIKRYVRYVTVGGYNTTWGYPKPVIAAFEKGTVLYYTLKKETKLTIPSVLLLGERVAEGYGEASVQILDGTEDIHELLEIDSSQESQAAGTVDAGESCFTYALCKDLFQDYVQMMAAQDANIGKFGLETRPTVSNMLLMHYENQDYNGVKESCLVRYGKNTDDKEKKLSYARKILESVEAGAETIQESFAKKYGIVHFTVDDNEVKMLYLGNFLKQLKYNFRQAEKRERDENNEQ